MGDWTEWQIRDDVRDLRNTFETFADDNQGQVTALRQRVTEIEQHLDRLSSGFFAFAELSDLRRELDAFAAENAWRSYALRLAAVRAAATVPAEPDLDDCPEYWLPPAARALAALLRGDEITAERHTAAAKSRDSERTALFLTLALAGAGQQALAAYWLREAFAPVEGPVSRAQRVLWTAAATDAFGAAGWELVVERLAGGVALTTEQTENEIKAWSVALSKRCRAFAVPAELRVTGDMSAEPVPSARRLALLRSWLAEPVPAGDPSAGVRELLRELIDEGSPVEAPLLARARELRATIGGETAQRSWRDPVGELPDLLRADVLDEADTRLRLIGLHGARPLVAELAARYAKTCADTPLPPAPARCLVRLTAHNHEVELVEGGAPELAAAEASIAEELKGVWGAKRRAREISEEQLTLADEAAQIAPHFDGFMAARRTAAQDCPAHHEAIQSALAYGRDR